MLSVLTLLCCVMAAAGTTTTQTDYTSSNVAAEPSRAAALTTLAAIARRHPERFPRLLAAFAAAAAAAAASADKDGDGGGGGTDFGARTLRWETPPEGTAVDWSTSETGESPDADSSNDATEDLSPVTVGSSGPASKRALSVLSRWQPFTSIGNGGRRASRFPHRGRPIGGPRDFISAETRGDFGDRPIGQPMRWGRR